MTRSAQHPATPTGDPSARTSPTGSARTGRPLRTRPRPVRHVLHGVTAVVVAVATAVAGLGGATASDAGEPPTASELLTPQQGVLFGAYVAQRSAPTATDAVAAFEESVGRKLDLVRWYARWDSPMPPQAVRDTVERGRTPVLSVEPRTLAGVRLSWADIAMGRHDARIREQAAAVRGLGVPLFLVFHHEPDMAAGHGTPAEYRAAWRRYVRVFRDAGVTNVAWTWVMTPASFGSRPATAGGDAYYPGDDVVDWLALDPYNWYGCSPGKPTTWRPMSEIAGPFRTWAAPRGKPLMLAEWNSAEDPADPGRRAAWYRGAATTLAGWPEVKAVAVFHEHGNCPWWVDSNPTSLQGFRDVAASAWAHGRATAWLRPSTTHGSAPLTVRFDASRSTGTGHQAGYGVSTWRLELGDGTVRSGTGRPPSALEHTYAGGTHRARLTVTDATGATSTDVRTVVAAPAPTVTGAERDRTTTSVGLFTWATTHGFAGTVEIEWGTTTSYGSTSGPLPLAAVAWSQQVSHTASGLAPGTTYHWRATVRTPAGTTVLTRTTETVGAPAVTWSSVSGTTATGTTAGGGIDPNSAVTTAWLEWGTSADALTSSSPSVTVPAQTWAVNVQHVVTGLRAGTTYHYRWVARNEHGTRYGTTRSFTTPRS